MIPSLNSYLNAVGTRLNIEHSALLHRMAMLVLALVSTISLINCSNRDDLPEVIADRTMCGNCRMLVSDEVHAAAFRVEGEDQVFDDLGCLLDKLDQEPAIRPESIWVRDRSRNEWIDARSATYIFSRANKTPMGFGYIAYAHHKDAERTYAEVGGAKIQGFEAVQAHFASRE